MLFMALAVSHGGYQYLRVKAHNRAVAFYQARGAYYVDAYIDPVGPNLWWTRGQSRLPSSSYVEAGDIPRWISDYASVRGCRLLQLFGDKLRVDDSLLKPAKDLLHLEWIVISDSEMLTPNGLSCLPGSLRALKLTGVDVSAEMLAKVHECCPRLNSLGLAFRKERLLEPAILLELGRFTTLEELSLSKCRISDVQFQRLKASLPRCNIDVERTNKRKERPIAKRAVQEEL